MGSGAPVGPQNPVSRHIFTPFSAVAEAVGENLIENSAAPARRFPEAFAVNGELEAPAAQEAVGHIAGRLFKSADVLCSVLGREPEVIEKSTACVRRILQKEGIIAWGSGLIGHWQNTVGFAVVQNQLRFTDIQVGRGSDPQADRTAHADRAEGAFVKTVPAEERNHFLSSFRFGVHKKTLGRRSGAAGFFINNAGINPNARCCARTPVSRGRRRKCLPRRYC